MIDRPTIRTKQIRWRDLKVGDIFLLESSGRWQEVEAITHNTRVDRLFVKIKTLRDPIPARPVDLVTIQVEQ